MIRLALPSATMGVATLAFLTVSPGPSQASNCERFSGMLKIMQADFEGIPAVVQANQELVLRKPPPPARACLGRATQSGVRSPTLICEYDARNETEARAMYKNFAQDVYACRPGQKPLASDGTKRPHEVEHTLAKNWDTREGWAIALFHRPGAQVEWWVEIGGVAERETQ